MLEARDTKDAFDELSPSRGWHVSWAHMRAALPRRSRECLATDEAGQDRPMGGPPATTLPCRESAWLLEIGDSRDFARGVPSTARAKLPRRKNPRTAAS
jgi:hypothetical protein